MTDAGASGGLAGRTRWLVLALFFLSGATGLAYQAVWFRHLQGLFGVTTHALAVVVAAFMGGLAIGSWLFGRIADRSPSPLRLYGLLELGVGVLAWLVAPGVDLVERIYVQLYPSFQGSLLGLSLLRLVLAGVVVLAPTILMGGTLPALTVWLRRLSARNATGLTLHRELAWLYGLNTLGAAAGTALAGFVLLGSVGLLRTTAIASVTNVVMGLVCVRLGRAQRSAPDSAAPERAAVEAPKRAAVQAAVRFAAIAFAISGGVSLVYEVAWTRALTQIIGSSTYAFSTILVAYLIGVGLGSVLLERWKGRDAAGLWGFALAQVGIAISAALVVPLFIRLPDLQLRGFASVEGIGGVLMLQFVLCLLGVLVPTLCMGATFPLVAGYVASQSRDVGRAIGRLYAGNTAGGIVGSMLAGFVTIPMWGSQRTILFAVLVNAGIALACVVVLLRQRTAEAGASPRRTATFALGGATVATAIGALLTPPWDPYVLDAGIAVGGPATTQGDRTLRLRDLGRGSEMLYYREGSNANISVRADETQYYLKTNGKTDGTSRGDMPTQFMFGLLPAILHPEPRTALVIGLGTGATARVALAPPELQHLDVVEIEPAVVEAARLWFGEVNGGLFSDPRTRLVVDDARAFLLTSPKRYDIIISEPSNPWIAGIANLFTVEHYQRCAARLEDGGIVAQWLQIYAMRPELVKMVLATMRQVFPHQSVWTFRHGDLVVLGSRAPLPPIDPAALDARLRSWKMTDDCRRIVAVDTGIGLVGYHLLSDADIERFAAGAALNTEDRPRLEFAAPLSLYLTTRDSNAELLRSARSRVLPDLVPGAQVDGGAMVDLARAAFESRRPGDAERWIEQAVAAPGAHRTAALALGGETALAGMQVELAEARLNESLQLDPQGSEAATTLATVRLMQGRNPEAAALLDAALQPDPQRTPKQQERRAELLDLCLRRGMAREVPARVAPFLAEPPRAARDSLLSARFASLAARAALELRDTAGAERLAQQALAWNPRTTAAWRVLGMVEFGAGRYPAAIEWWKRCVEFRQTDPDLLLPLAVAYERSGQRDEALHWIDRVLVQDPQNSDAQRLRGRFTAS